MSLSEKRRCVIPLDSPVRSLCWDGDELIDWVGGGTRFSLTGEIRRADIYFAYRFDRALLRPDRKLAVLYEALGTKGLVIRGDEVVREINRSFYHASEYEYPIALFNLSDGTAALAHCPAAYNKIEIEELESSRRLTERTSEPVDFFHSRLQVSSDGAYLISAGWVWHPLDSIQIFRLPEVLQKPELWDCPCELELPAELFEIHTAVFQNNDVLLLAGDGADADNPKPFLAGYSLGRGRTIFTVALDTAPGTMMPLGAEHVIGFYEHPKLFEIGSGKMIHQWPELKSGRQNSSIIHHHDAIPPLALDPAKKRFAVAGEQQITVIELE